MAISLDRIIAICHNLDMTIDEGGTYMSIVKYKNQSGQVYAYEQTSFWDPEKKQSRSKRKLLGRVDPDTGEIIPTEKRRGRPKKSDSSDASADDLSVKYEDVLSQLEEMQETVTALRSENERILNENRLYRELLSMIHEKTSL